MRKLLTINLILLYSGIYAQNVGIGTTTPNASSQLEVSSTDKGILIPRMTQAQRIAITNPAQGLLVYQTDGSSGFYVNKSSIPAVPNWSIVTEGTNQWNAGIAPNSIYNVNAGNVGIGTTNPSAKLEINGQIKITGGSPGVNKVLVSDATGTANWQSLSAAGAWSLSGNAGTTSASFLGTTDNNPLTFKVNNLFAGQIDHIDHNVSLGFQALLNNTFAQKNIAIGNNALKTQSFVNGNVAYRTNNIAIGDSALFNNNPSSSTDGNNNIAIGNNALNKNTTGNSNTATGFRALYSNTTGFSNTANGMGALSNNIDGGENTATGYQALTRNTSGTDNTASGHNALFLNTTGSYNTANGASALISNTTGGGNTAIGNWALQDNTIGYYNTASGFEALFSNTEGFRNSAIGSFALYRNTTGNYNTAAGNGALSDNTTGYSNVAVGASALQSNSTRSNLIAIGDSALLNNGNGATLSTQAIQNTATGSKALITNTTGSDNTAMGYQALNSNATGSTNTAIGSRSLHVTTGSQNTALGYNAFPTTAAVNNYTGIGYNVGSASSNSNMVEIGNTSVTVIRGQVGFTTYSDARIKDNVQDNIPGLAFIKQLRPVTYNLNIHRQNEMMYGKAKPDHVNWAGKYDIENIRMSGFLAQEVDAAAKKTGYDFSGVVKPQNENDLYSLRYAEFVVPMVKAMQEQQALIENQQKQIDELKAMLKQITEQKYN